MINLNFTKFPILTTERLRLRQLSHDDQLDIFALRSDAVINKYLDRKPSTTVEDALRFIDNVNENIRNNTSIYWAITLIKTKTFVGTICLYNFSTKNNSCEVGYELKTNFQGQGIMKEALEVVINYTFETLQFCQIIAFTHKGNQKSTKLLTTLQFVQSEDLLAENPDINIFKLARLN